MTIPELTWPEPSSPAQGSGRVRGVHDPFRKVEVVRGLRGATDGSADKFA